MRYCTRFLVVLSAALIVAPVWAGERGPGQRFSFEEGEITDRPRRTQEWPALALQMPAANLKMRWDLEIFVGPFNS